MVLGGRALIQQLLAATGLWGVWGSLDMHHMKVPPNLLIFSRFYVTKVNITRTRCGFKLEHQQRHRRTERARATHVSATVTVRRSVDETGDAF